MEKSNRKSQHHKILEKVESVQRGLIDEATALKDIVNLATDEL